MEIKNKIISGGLEITGARVMEIDVSTSSAHIPFGEVHLDNSDGSLSVQIEKGDTLDVYTSLVYDPDTEPVKIITGKVKEIYPEQRFRITIQGTGAKYHDIKFKRSYNQVKGRRVLNDIINEAGIAAIFGTVPEKDLHTFISPNGSALEEINRVITSFGLDLAPYWDRNGTLILKSVSENQVDRSTVFNAGEFLKFENYILQTALDSQIDLYNIVTVLDKKYYVTAHRFKANHTSAKSLITLADYAE
jgi:hypothetical protein